MGDQNGKFRHPHGIAIHPNGKILVVDLYNNRIQVFDRDGNFLYKFGSEGKQPGQFDMPQGIAMDP